MTNEEKSQKTKCCDKSQGKNKAFTLIEVIIIIVIISLALVPLLEPFTLLLSDSAVPEKNYAAVNLARGLMDEILSKGFEEGAASFGLEAGEAPAGPRSAYDDVDDFDNWSSTPPQDMSGSSLADYPEFTRSVAISNVLSDDLEVDTDDGATDYKKIQVTVFWSTGGSISLAGLKVKK